jgi:hypothetical protein
MLYTIATQLCCQEIDKKILEVKTLLYYGYLHLDWATWAEFILGSGGIRSTVYLWGTFIKAKIATNVS